MKLPVYRAMALALAPHVKLPTCLFTAGCARPPGCPRYVGDLVQDILLAGCSSEPNKDFGALYKTL